MAFVVEEIFNEITTTDGGIDNEDYAVTVDYLGVELPVKGFRWDHDEQKLVIEVDA